MARRNQRSSKQRIIAGLRKTTDRQRPLTKSGLYVSMIDIVPDGIAEKIVQQYIQQLFIGGNKGFRQRHVVAQVFHVE